MMILGHAEKVKEAQKSGIVSAFYSAYFYRKEKLSGADLEEVLERIDGRDDLMTDELMYAMAKRLSGM